ncbi:MAG: hypothetical protein HY881_14485 [Deltaproteobacteria bacterium]|nr:hypothetical protein [Deltaproteobacteria bacterium]
MNKDNIANMAAVFLQAFIAHGKSETERAFLRGEPTELFSQIRVSIPTLNIRKFIKPVLAYLTERGLLIEVLKERKDGKSKIYSTVNMGEQTVTTVTVTTDTKTA